MKSLTEKRRELTRRGWKSNGKTDVNERWHQPNSGFLDARKMMTIGEAFEFETVRIKRFIKLGVKCRLGDT